MIFMDFKRRLDLLIREILEGDVNDEELEVDNLEEIAKMCKKRIREIKKGWKV